MAAIIATLCDDITTHLGTLSLSQAFTAERAHPNYVDLEDAANTGYRVFVYPNALQKQIVDREAFGRTYEIYVHIAKKMTSLSQAAALTEIDECMELAEEIEDSLAFQDFDPFSILQFGSEINGRFPFELQTLNERDFFHVPIAIHYVSVD